MDYGVPALTVKDGRVVVSSRDVAQVFSKRHEDVLRDIDNVLELAGPHAADLRDVMFQVVSSPHPTVPGRSIRSFELSRDGFTLLAMGYTGARALQFKLAYIRRFNEMEEALRGPQVPMLPTPPAPPPQVPGLTIDEVDRRIDERVAAVLRGALFSTSRRPQNPPGLFQRPVGNMGIE